MSAKQATTDRPPSEGGPPSVEQLPGEEPAQASPSQEPRRALRENSPRGRLVVDTSPNRRRLISEKCSAGSSLPALDECSPNVNTGQGSLAGRKPPQADQPTRKEDLAETGNSDVTGGSSTVFQSSSLDTTTKPSSRQNRHRVGTNYIFDIFTHSFLAKKATTRDLKGTVSPD